MSQEAPTKNLFSYLDNIMGKDGIKTTNKIEMSVDSETAVILFGIGAGLVVFSHLLGVVIRAASSKKG